MGGCGEGGRDHIVREGWAAGGGNGGWAEGAEGLVGEFAVIFFDRCALVFMVSIRSPSGLQANVENST